MKDKIIEVIDNNINTPFADHEFNSLVDQLAALMCYREVRAFMEGKALMEWVSPVIIFLTGRYESHVILKTIKQVKKEMT